MQINEKNHAHRRSSGRQIRSADCLYPPEPAPLHHFTTPSSPPVTKAPELPIAGGLGLQETAQTLSVSWTVETAARAPISQILMLLSADLYFID